MKIVHVLRKPCSEGTAAANVLRHGTGALNIDATRIGTTDSLNGGAYSGGVRPMTAMGLTGEAGGASSVFEAGGGRLAPENFTQPTGRWPANFILQHLDGCVQEGTRKVKAIMGGSTSGDNAFGQDSGWNSHENKTTGIRRQGDPDGTETVAAWACAEGCPVAGLDAQSGVTKSTGGRAVDQFRDRNPIYGGGRGSEEARDPGFGDTGGASRFFKQLASDDALLDYLRTLTVPAGGVFVATAEGEPWGQEAGTVHAVLLVGEAARDIGEAFRVLRPGGHLLLVGPDRLGFRGACIAEDAGFEVRDAIFVADDSEDQLHYVAKAATREREEGLSPAEGKRANTHPTVKPIRVMERLLKSVDPGDLVVDPFLGSGTTGLAARRTGHTFVGIEREEEYVQIALARLRQP